MANKIVQLTQGNDNIFPIAGGMKADSITTEMLQDGSVTSDKVDFTTIAKVLWSVSGSSGIQPTTADPITLSDSLADYDYIEVYASNNSSGNQGIQAFKFTTDSDVISINFYHMLANNVYIRSTRYLITNNTTIAQQGAAYQNQCTITTGPTVTFYNGSDGIYLWKIVGYKNLP